MKSLIKYAGCECGLSDDELRAAVRESLSDCKANLKKVLLLPPVIPSPVGPLSAAML